MTQTADTSTRTTLIVAIGVVLLLVTAIAVAAARGVSPTPVAEKPAAEAPSEPATASPAPSGTATAAPGTPGTKPGGAPSAGKTGGPSGSGSRPDPSAPTKPADAGSKLTTLTAPPERTIGMIAIPKGFKSAQYDITFTPYGWGPAGQSGGRLVAKIVTSKAADAGATELKKDFTGRNATLWCAPAVAKGITLGGTYSAVLTVLPQGDVGVLHIAEVKAVK